MATSSVGTLKTDIQSLTSFGSEGKEIVKNDTYEIVDMELKDMYGFVKQTISRTVLYPNKHTRGHMHNDQDETYYFIKGTGLIILQGEDLNKIHHIEPETWLYIPKKTFHMVMNLSKNEDLEFLTVYPGESQRPPIEKPPPDNNKKKK